MTFADSCLSRVVKNAITSESAEFQSSYQLLVLILVKQGYSYFKSCITLGASFIGICIICDTSKLKGNPSLERTNST
jgi:hypothetical protein